MMLQAWDLNSSHFHKCLTGFYYKIKDRLLWGIELALRHNKLNTQEYNKLFR